MTNSRSNTAAADIVQQLTTSNPLDIARPFNTLRERAPTRARAGGTLSRQAASVNVQGWGYRLL